MYSFDVFDTLITRMTATPQGVFYVMQNRLQTEQKYEKISLFIKTNYAELRINAEVLARRNYQVEDIEDVTLNEIYNAFEITGCLGADERRLLMELEEETEWICSVGIQKNINYLKELLKSGEKVVLISDMYLGKSIIRKLLVKADPIFENLPLYVSSEYKKSKVSGNLFWVVKKCEKTEFPDWVHYGDNPKGDYAVPQKLGIKAVLNTYKTLKPIEKNILENQLKNSFVQLTVGCSQNTRILYDAENEHALGITVGAPTLFSYVYWILEEAQNKNIERLYFIARDGYILQKIADIIIERRKLSIVTKYIYGSRKAWRMASLNEKNRDIRELLAWSHWNHVDTVSQIADIFEITEQELYTFLPPKYQKCKKIDTLAKTEIQRFLEGDKFIKFLIEKHKEKREIVKDYLQENIDFQDNQFAFVELAGSGYTQMCLSYIIEDFYAEPIQTFFFKTDKIWHNEKCLLYTFLPSRLQQNILIEVLCHAPHGQTSGYKKVEGKTIAVIEKYEEEQLQKHGINEYIEGILFFTKEYLKVIDTGLINPLELTILLHYMNYLAKCPDAEILNFIADMPNSVTGREKKIISYAPRLTKSDIRNIFLKRTYEPIEYYYKGTSLNCSLLRCTQSEQKRIAFYKKHHNDILGNILRLPKTIREGKFDVDSSCLIPEDLSGKRIILYAAGNLGQAYYSQFSKTKRVKIILWVDQNWEELRKIGLPVSDPKEILKMQYDKILIAVKNEGLAQSICDYLVELGVDREKINNEGYKF